MRQVAPGKQRASVERSGRISFSKEGAGGHGSGEHGSGGHGSGGSGGSAESRQYPSAALWVVLVVGVLLGLLFAGVISSFIGGSSDSNSSSSGTKSTPKAGTSGQSDSTDSTDSRKLTESRQADGSPINRDVSILGCGSDAQGFASARVQITNNSAERATYYVRVLFLAADGRYVSDDVASVKHLPAGQTAPLQPVKAVEFEPGEQVNCVLGSVSRF